MPMATRDAQAPLQSAMDREVETRWLDAKGDTTLLSELMQRHGQKLLKIASRGAGPNEMQLLLDVAQRSDPKAEQVVLEHSALAGNVPLFEWMLQQRMCPTPRDLSSTWLRLYAAEGGVGIWTALLAYHHDCINWEIGEHGDALGQAVMKRDAALVRFLLEEGTDVRKSNFVGMSAMETAKSIGAGPEILDLLETYGAQE